MKNAEAAIINHLTNHRNQFEQGKRMEQGEKRVYIPCSKTKAWDNLIKNGVIAMYRRPHTGGLYFFLKD